MSLVLALGCRAGMSAFMESLGETVGGGAAAAIAHARLLPQQIHGEVANAASSDRPAPARDHSGTPEFWLP